MLETETVPVTVTETETETETPTPVTVTETAVPVAVVAESNVDDIGHAAAAKRRLSVSPNHRGLLSNVLRVPAVPPRPSCPALVPVARRRSDVAWRGTCESRIAPWGDLIGGR